jgi:hypothetical protein
VSVTFEKVRFMRIGLDFNSAKAWKCEESSPVRIGGFEMTLRDFVRINHHLKWGELISIQSKDWINFDPVLVLDQYTSPGIQYYHVSKIKQYGWLI